MGVFKVTRGGECDQQCAVSAISRRVKAGARHQRLMPRLHAKRQWRWLSACLASRRHRIGACSGYSRASSRHRRLASIQQPVAPCQAPVSRAIIMALTIAAPVASARARAPGAASRRDGKYRRARICVAGCISRAKSIWPEPGTSSICSAPISREAYALARHRLPIIMISVQRELLPREKWRAIVVFL